MDAAAKADSSSTLVSCSCEPFQRSTDFRIKTECRFRAQGTNQMRRRIPPSLVVKLDAITEHEGASPNCDGERLSRKWCSSFPSQDQRFAFRSQPPRPPV